MSISDKLYTFLCSLFAAIVVIGNLTYQKFVSLPILPFHTFELSVGAILYPITFLITDLISEFYGKERASFCVTNAMRLSVLAAIIISFMVHLNATPWSKIDNSTFSNIFGMYNVAFISSIIACYISQNIDVRIYLLIRKLTNGRFLWLRSNLSIAISLLVDTTIVIVCMTIYGIFSAEHSLKLILNSYTYKLFFTICSTPIFYLAVAVIRRTLKQ